MFKIAEDAHAEAAAQAIIQAEAKAQAVAEFKLRPRQEVKSRFIIYYYSNFYYFISLFVNPL
jgi:hypothetical protein